MQALAAGWRDHPDTLPLLRERATTDPHWRVRQAAVQALATD
ncbi:MAG: HEAT repeat domain-containing protein [Pseudonocardiaceae bacterium]